MANQSYLNFEDELRDDNDLQPLSSVSSRNPLEDLSLQGRADSAPSSDDDESDLDVPPVAPSPNINDPSQAVRNAIAQKFGSPQPPPSVGGAADYSNDPLMKQYEAKEKEIQDFRQAQRGADQITNIGQAAAQAAQGSRAPAQDNALYTNIQKQNHDLLKGSEDDLGRRQRIVNAIEQRKSREGIASDNRASRNALLGLRADQAQTAADTKATDKQNQSYHQVVQMLESARNNPAVGQAEKDIYAADKAKSLATLYGDPNKLSNSQVQLFASELAKIASGGVPTQHELEGLTPNTLTGKLSGVYSKFANEPTAANAGKFIKQYQDYANALTKDAQKTISDRYGRIITGAKGQVSADQFKNLNDNYIGRFSQGGAPAAPSTGSSKVGQLVKYQGKMYKVGADGDTLEEAM